MYRLAKLGTFVFAAAFALAAGCGTTQKSSPLVPNAPDWVNKGSGAFKDGMSGQVFYGVGSVQGVRNIPLMRSAAEDRGRGAIAQILNSYVVRLCKDYMSSTSNMEKSSEEQLISSTQKTFTKFTLVGATPVDMYVDRSDPKNVILYSLVKLDMAAMKKSLEEAKELDSKMRDYIKANAEKAFDELAAEEAKH